MYYGDDIVVTKKGLIIKEKALLPVGISDNSICWGVELSPHPDNIGDQFPHLVISAFPPEHWHSLFQIVIRIKNRRGSLEEAAKVLDDLGINILSTQCAPSGHSHATWHLIGEDLVMKERFDRKLNELFGKEPSDPDYYNPQISVIDAEGNDDFVLKLEKEISQKAFQRSREIEDFIFAKGKGAEGYLRMFCRDRETIPCKTFDSDKQALLFTEENAQYSALNNSAGERAYRKKSLLYTDKTFHDEETLEKLKESSAQKIADEETKIKGRINRIEEEIAEKDSEKDRGEIEKLTARKNKLQDEIEAFKQIVNDRDYINFAEMFRREEAETVISRWSKNMAVFRIYSQANKLRGSIANYDRPICFRYNAENELLTPRWEGDQEQYDKLIDYFAAARELPLGAIAAFDPQERYVRFVFPNRKKKISIQLKYNFALDKDGHARSGNKSSKGLLLEVTKKINKNNINLDYVENSIISYSTEKEVGKISLIGTFEDDRDDKVEKIVEDVKKELETGLFSNLKNFPKDSASFKANVSELGVKKIFISTKFDFINEIKPNFKVQLIKTIREYGFIPTFGDPTETPARQDDPDLEETISKRIKSCDGFLLLIPKQLSLTKCDKNEETDQAWLLYEFGIARGADIPFEICVDESKLDEYPVKIGLKWAKFRFNSSKDTEDILKEIKKALTSLRKKLYRKDNG